MTGKRILLVDDERFVAEGVKMILEMDDHLVDLVMDAEQALEEYNAGKYDLVLTDHCMPGMTGLELAEKIRMISPAQPILLLTGFPPSGPRLPVDIVMRKPFDGDALRSAVVRLTTPT